jgi:hypothetical protein
MKFEIFKSEKDKKFYFRLKARNGQVILSSQGYADKAGAKNGIRSVQTHSKKDENFERKESKNGKFHFNLVASNKQIIGSSQVYRSKQSMETGIQSVRRVAPQAVVQEE